MKSKLLITLLLAQCLLSACNTLDRHGMDTDLAVQHEALAKHFEAEAAEIQAKMGSFDQKHGLYQATPVGLAIRGLQPKYRF